MSRILLVDDSKSLRSYLKLQLYELSAVFLEARDGDEGLRMAREHKPDLIIADVLMPVMTGIELLEEIRRDPELAATPVIVVTGSRDSYERLSAAPDPNTYLVMKPVNDAGLTRLAQRILGG
jgi:CheY-like chemotaxis protein